MTLDIPLHRTSYGRLIPYVLGIMLYLGIVVTVIVTSGNRLSHEWQTRLQYKWSIELQLPPPDESEPTSQVLAHTGVPLLQQIRQMPGVISANLVDPQAVVKELQPWIGEINSQVQEQINLAMPLLFEVEMDSQHELSQAVIDRELPDYAAHITLHHHQSWYDGLISFLHGINNIAIGAAGLIAFALIAIIIAIIRFNHQIHHKTIKTLQLLGATDEYILKQFLLYTASIYAKSMGIGVIASAITLGGFSAFNQVLPIIYDWIVLGIALSATSLIVMWAAKITVQKSLKDIVN